MSEPQDDRISGKAWFTLGVLLVMIVLSYLDRGIIGLLVRPIREDLHISDVQVSLLYGVSFGLFYAVFSFPLGWLADRWSRRGVIYLCITGWSLATAACGLANSFWQLAVARFGVGVGEGGLSPAAYRMLGAAFPKRRMALTLGIFGAGASLATPISQIVGGRLVDWAVRIGGVTLPVLGDVKPWQLVFLILGPPGVLLAPLIFLIPRETRNAAAHAAQPAPAVAGGDGFGAFLRSRWRYLTLHFLGFGLIAMLSYGVGGWTPTFFERRFGMHMSEIGLYLGLVAGGFGMVGFVGGGWVADRWFSRGVKDAHLRYYVIGLPVTTLATVLAFTVVDRPAYAFGLLAFIFLLLPFTGPAVGHLQLSTPVEFRGRTTALFTMVFNILGMTLGPLIVALLTEHVFRDPAKVGLSIALMTGVLGVVALVIFCFSLKPAREAIAAQGT
ncbi:MFS transporter [Phenylobacterium sp.]|uniref:MFS transporter n=1 Tax=Phenylobacterium sp. TaxID=1871053 RepID=UPI002F407D85